MCHEKVSQFLQLDSDQVQFLINTQQIVAIHLVGPSGSMTATWNV
jgi:hypothetical protein